MLETSSLLLSLSEPRKGSDVQIKDAAGGIPLGRARATAPSGWRRWFAPRNIEVLETEDDSLVFTLCRGWSLAPGWWVDDADGRRVGRLSRQARRLEDAHTLATLHDTAFRSPAGRELATLETVARGVRITFRPIVADQPFVKMLLLAAAVARLS